MQTVSWRAAARNIWPLLTLTAYYALIIWAVYHPPALASHLTGAAAEPGPVYGFWSGFGGTLLFSAAVLAPPWYYQHSCHHHFSCLRWGRYAAAGGTFKLCAAHYPTPRKPGESRHEWIKRLHGEWQAKR